MKYLSTSYFKSSGGTNMYAAIDKSFSLFEEINSKDTLKMMIVLSDGQSSDTSRHSSILSTANSKNVRIYTVGLGNSSSYFNNYLKPLAVNTAGKFYIATQSQELASIYDDINMKIDIEMDSDKDGISDYYEDNMVIFNGTKFC
jgi:Mg-chelatase subunit ChlD